MASRSKELMPDQEVIDILRGVISEPMQTKSHKPGSEGQPVTVRFALEGSGMHGLTDYIDNQTWWGISRMHQGLSARLAVYYGMVMQQAGYEVNLGTILSGMNISHPGRRPWEEACFYPEVAPDAAVRSAMTNETLGLLLIQNKVPHDIFLLVASLAYSDKFPVDKKVYDSLEHRLSDLADHQTTDRFAPLGERMGDFLARNFFVGLTTEALKRPVIEKLSNIIKSQRDFCLGISGSKEVTLNEAEDIMLEMGASPNSPRSTLRLQLENYLKDAGTQAMLIRAGINPDEITDQTVPMPAWEDSLRLEYVGFARDSLIEAVRQGYPVPFDTEWGRCVQIVLPRSLRKT